MAPSLTYPKTPKSTVNRYNHRAQYDLATVHSIVNECPMIHISFIPDPTSPSPFPVVLPMIGALGSFEHPSAGLDEPLDLYVHGYVSSRVMNSANSAGTGSSASGHPDSEQGMPVCVCASILDGLILSLTPNTHDYNYRSAVLHGYANIVTDTDEKLYAMELITNSVVPNRWQHTRIPPDSAEMSSTRILRVKITSASAKIRTGGPKDEKKDLGKEELLDNVWTGIIPVYQSLGEPIAGEYNRVQGVPEHVTGYVKDLQDSKEKDAIRIAHTEGAPKPKDEDE